MKFEALVTLEGLKVQGPLLCSPRIFQDSRGCFFESWNENSWKKNLFENCQDICSFVQDNHSSSIRGVLRGLHYQINPHPQGKLVRCVRGEIFDVAVDLRYTAKTFGKWVGARLSAENYKQLWIPNGFAHGFLTISDHADVLYKTTDFWDKESERSIRWDDPDLSIDWPVSYLGEDLDQPILSDKDGLAPYLKNLCEGDLFV